MADEARELAPYIAEVRAVLNKTALDLDYPLREALEGLLANIAMHHDKSCPGITPADCLDAIYEAANVARAVLAPASDSVTTPQKSDPST